MWRLWIALFLLWPWPAVAQMAGGPPNAGVVDQYMLDYSGAVDVNRGGTAMACWDFTGAVGGTLADQCGSYNLTVNGAPTRVQYAGTWPEGLSGTQGEAWYFDGVGGDCLSLADASGGDDFDFGSGQFTVLGAAKNDASASRYLISKYLTTGNKRSWAIRTVNADFYLDVSDDGVNVDSLIKASVIAANRPFFFAVTYDGSGGAGAGEGRIYVDEAVAASSSALRAPLYDGDSALSVSGVNSCGTQHTNTIYFLVVIPQILSDAQITSIRRQWRGLMAASGNTVTVTAASPPAVMVAPPGAAGASAEPFFFDQPANTTMVGSPAAGSGGVYGAAGITNLCHRGSLETWAAGSPSGWTETSGGGTSDATQNTTSMAHGLSSAQMLCDGVNTLTLDSACKTLTGSTAYYGSAYALTTAGVPNLTLQLLEYTDGACSVGLVTTNLWGAGDPGAAWTRIGGTRTTGAGVNSGRLRILIDTNAATALVDGAMLRASGQPTDALCVADADASAVCNLSDQTMLSTTGEITPGEWQINATVRSPIDGAVATPVRQIVRVPGTAGNNNRIDLSWASDVLTCTVYDSGGVARTSTVAAAGNADTDYNVMMAHTADGRVECCWGGTCDATPATLAVTDGVGSEVVYGSDGTTGGEVWVDGVKWKRRYDP